MAKPATFLKGGGEMGNLIRAADWSDSPLGKPDTWPESLRYAMSIALNSGFPIAVYWGADFILLYNDAWSSIPGGKHPWALGKKGTTVWPEIWDGLRDEFNSVLNKGESIRRTDALLLMHRHGYTEECYFDYTLSPVIATDGSIGGVFNAVIETTYRVINERRNKTLYQFQVSQNNTHTIREGFSNIVKILNAAEADIPFCILHSAAEENPQGVNHSAHIGITREMDQTSKWPDFGDLEKKSFHIPDLDPVLPHPFLSKSLQVCIEALVVPITKGSSKINGHAILGISPRKRLDADYQVFLESVGLHIGAVLNAGYAHEQDVLLLKEQALNEELAAANEELYATNEELNEAHEDLRILNQKLEDRVRDRTVALELAQREASRERDRLHDFFMQAPAGICVLEGEDLVFGLVNSVYQDLFPGRPLPGKPILEALPELKGTMIDDKLRDVFDKGEPFEGNELLLPLARGQGNEPEERYFNFIFQPRKNLDGITDGVLVFVFEVTESIISRRKAEASEKQFSFLLNAIPQQVWTARPDGSLDYVNQVVCNDFGKPMQDITNHGWQAFVHPEDFPQSIQAWKRSMETFTEYQVEFRLLMQDGTYKWHLGKAVPLIENGRPRLWIGTNTNIELQKSNELKKDEFLSIASHELKTPLTTIKALNQLMHRTNDAGMLSNFAAKSSQHILRLEKLISDLLDVTKINAGKLNYNMQVFNFRQMLINSIEIVQHISPSHKVVLESAPDIEYHGDILRLEQVMNNFLTNAIKYSPGTEKVVVNCYLEADNIIVSVRDTGIGIAPQHLDRLFDRYYRVDNTAMRFEGLGLGLFISAEILKRHQGNFWIESDPGRGSSFYFRLPLRRDGKTEPTTQTDTYYKDSHITITLERPGLLYADWTGYQDVSSVQQGCRIMLEMLIRLQCNRVINDNTHVTGSWSEAAEWVAKEWFPMMERAGLKYFAWIYSENTFSQMSARKTVDIMVGNIVTRFFTNFNEAREFITAKETAG